VAAVMQIRYCRFSLPLSKRMGVWTSHRRDELKHAQMIPRGAASIQIQLFEANHMVRRILEGRVDWIGLPETIFILNVTQIPGYRLKPNQVLLDRHVPRQARQR
jgi:hypothetical protein